MSNKIRTITMDKMKIPYSFGDFIADNKRNYNDCLLGSFSRAALKHYGKDALDNIHERENGIEIFQNVSPECLAMFNKVWDTYIEKCDKEP